MRSALRRPPWPSLVIAALTSCADLPNAATPACPRAAWDFAEVGVTSGNTTVARLHAVHFGTSSAAPPPGCGASGSTRRASLRYVTRGAGRIVVSWQSSAPVAADLWVTLACDAGAPPLACAGGWVPRAGATSRLVARRSVPAGTALDVVLATSAARGVLEVTEVVDAVPLGARCDRAIRADRCADGADCVGGACAPEGSASARCRDAAPRCDPGLACDAELAPGGRCVPVAAPGAPCPTGGTRCEGGRCVVAGLDVRCVRDGDLGGACRATGAPCAGDLGCTRGTCAPRVASGAPCALPDGRTAACPEGEACSDDLPPRCVPAGRAAAPCRAPPPHCDDGFVCVRNPMFPSTGRCVARGETPARCTPGDASSCPFGAVCAGPDDAPRCAWPGAAGGLCDLHGRCDEGLVCVLGGVGTRSECVAPGAPGSPCAFTPDGDSSCAAPNECRREGDRARCFAPGAPGGPCRGGSSPCEPGLACSHARLCAPALAAAAACDPEGVLGACPGGRRCAFGACVDAGEPGGFCRATAPSCAAGLRCGRDGATSGVCVEG